jgi:hypothetical protein
MIIIQKAPKEFQRNPGNPDAAARSDPGKPQVGDWFRSL